MDLSKYTKYQIDKMREALNLTEDEEAVFNLLAKKYSIIEIYFQTGMSVATISRRIRSIKDKMIVAERECLSGTSRSD